MLDTFRTTVLLALWALTVAPSLAHADDETTSPATTSASSTTTSATSSTATATEAAPAPAPPPFIAHLNFGVVAYNWLGASGDLPSGGANIADRQTIVQLAGFGYFVQPNLRLMLSVQLAETVGGGKPGASAFSLAGAIPWVAWHPIPPLFLGVGVLLAPRSYGAWKFDAGLFTCIGATLPLGGGFALGAAVQVPIMFAVRLAVSVVPAVFVAYRF